MDIGMSGYLTKEDKAVADGWIEWAGGECPVDGEALVDVRFVGGEECSGERACAWDWTYENRDFDITAYRVVPA